MTLNPARTAQSFVASLGVNTHLDSFGNYADLNKVAANIRYLGVGNVRDAAQDSRDLGIWTTVAKSAGIKFDDYIGQASQAGMRTDLGYVTALAKAGILNAVEGGNEEDGAWPISQGNSLAATARFQSQVYALGHSLGLPVINMSFGHGWTAADNWHGNYDAVGSLSAVTDYANGHVYPSGTPASIFNLIKSDAALAAPGRPLIDTEFGYNTSAIPAATAAKYLLDGFFDAYRQGTVRTYAYALYDDGSGAFGLMNANGTPRPAATALHNLTTLLHDTGSAAVDSLDYTLSGMTGNDRSVLLEKSDGSHWLALWDEADKPHNVSLSLRDAASRLSIYDPVSGTNATQTASNTRTATVTVTDRPILVEIAPAEPAAATPAPAQATPAPAKTTEAVTVASDDRDAVVSVSNQTIRAGTGDHAIFINGHGNTLTATGGQQTVQAYAGGNAITTGGSNDVIRVAGSGNRVDASSGHNTIMDSGHNNTIVLPGAGQGTDDLYGYILQNDDVLDLRAAMAGTSWDGSSASLSHYLSITPVNNGGDLQVSLSRTASGSASVIAVLHGEGSVDADHVLQHVTLR